MQRYIVESSDVLQDLRINVSDERSGRIVWYKERYLTDKEIVENVVHYQTSTVVWSIHRPKRGWYIRIRAPSFPPGVFIHLKPTPARWADTAALCFVSRTTISGGITEIANSSTSTVHSYPPTPPALNLDAQPPSPTQVSRRLEETQAASSSSSKLPRRSSTQSPSQITHFILSPCNAESSPSDPTETGGFLSRALAIWNRTTGAASYKGNSFILSRILPPSATVGGGTLPDTSMPPKRPSNISRPSLVSANSSTALNPSGDVPPITIPVLKFTDRTPVYALSAQTGLLEIDSLEESKLGIDTSFWVVIALAYGGFLNDRESYLAAMND